jgi:hypothetical protein
VLVLSWWNEVAVSSSQAAYASVFTLSNHHLQSVQQIAWDTHSQAGLAKDTFNPSTNTLLIRAAHHLPDDAHCCVSALDVITFRWNGSRFIQTEIHTELSEYGKSEHKTLPTAP